jgi:dATP pyrophosphohydrolase
MPYKIPRSVLVVIHTSALDVLLLERAPWPGYWQSVTGSLDHEDEPLALAAAREVEEETGRAVAPQALDDWGIDNRYEIFAEWRWKYAPGVNENVEHVFGLVVPDRFEPHLAPAEHAQWVWLPWREAAAKCFSWSNRDAILLLPRRAGRSA